MSEDMPPARGGPDPRLPPPVASWLRARLDVPPGWTVATIGAPPWVAAVFGPGARAAVEVSASLRPPATGAGRAARVVAAAEVGVPLRSGSLDAAVLGPFVHRGCALAAVRETARAVRIGGCLLVLRRTCDTSLDWVNRARRIAAGPRDAKPGPDRERSVEALAAAPGCGPLSAATVDYREEWDVDEVVERFAATSRVRMLPPDQQGVALDSLRDLLSTHPDTRARRRLAVPYRVEAHWCERVAEDG